MATNTKLKPYRQVYEGDIVNLFAYSGAIPVTAGTVVQGGGSGWRPDDTDSNQIGNVGVGFGNTLSTRWGTLPFAIDATTGAPILGILLYDVREQDENGLLYKFNPQKAAENNHVLSGQTAPILVQGFVLISGVFNGATVAVGSMAYPSGAGVITTNSENQNASSTVGKFFGARSSDGFALLHVNVQ